MRGSPAARSTFAGLAGALAVVVFSVGLFVGQTVADRKPDDPILRAGMSVTVDIDTGHRRSLSELF